MIVNFLSLLALMAGLLQPQHVRIGTIEFFGTGGIDVQTVRSVLPVHEQDALTEDQMPAVRNRITKAIRDVLGHPPSDVSFVCCNDQQSLMIYVGLGGSNTVTVPLLPEPKGSTCLPEQAVTLYGRAMDAVAHAAENNNIGEDDSRGYALAYDPRLRVQQLAMRRYAATRVQMVELALRDCGQPEHRRAAAELLGYAKQSETQIRDLVHASRDTDEEVRNNAVRALGVLAASSTKISSGIPAQGFIGMLNSGVWEDRNKAGMLLMTLTRTRPPSLLKRLRSEALTSLVEMARWKDASHSHTYKTILGRMAGFDEAYVEHLILNGRVDEIVAGAERRQ